MTLNIYLFYKVNGDMPTWLFLIMSIPYITVVIAAIHGIFAVDMKLRGALEALSEEGKVANE